MESRIRKNLIDETNIDNKVLETRSSRNAKLYRDVYGDYDELDNLPVEDNADEIDIKKLRELVLGSEQSEDSKQIKENLNVLEQKKRIIDEQKIYDINKILEKAKYENNKFVLISSAELALPSYIKDILKARGCEYTEVSTIEEAIGTLDVLYMTRIQKERFASEEEYLRQKNIYVLDTAKMKKASDDMIVLHPLPRVDEITIDVDDDPRALYFKQAANGVYARMALIISILENNLSKQNLISGYTNKDVCCHNKKCITATETYLPHAFKAAGDILECEFCDERLLLEKILTPDSY